MSIVSVRMSNVRGAPTGKTASSVCIQHRVNLCFRLHPPYRVPRIGLSPEMDSHCRKNITFQHVHLQSSRQCELVSHSLLMIVLNNIIIIDTAYCTNPVQFTALDVNWHSLWRTIAFAVTNAERLMIVKICSRKQMVAPRLRRCDLWFQESREPTMISVSSIPQHNRCRK